MWHAAATAAARARDYNSLQSTEEEERKKGGTAADRARGESAAGWTSRCVHQRRSRTNRKKSMTRDFFFFYRA